MSSVPPRPEDVSPAAELVPIPREALPVRHAVRAIDMYAALLADAPTENTRQARAHDIETFRRFLGADSPETACALFLAAGRGGANAFGLAFRNHERERGLAPSTINRKNATLRRLAKLAARLDVITFAVEIDDLKDGHVPDRRGPGVDGWRALWAAAVAAGDNPVARRDRAMLLLMHGQALRKGEVIGLDLADVDLARPGVWIKGKGRGGRKETVTVNESTAAALAEWIDARGEGPGPLFLAKRKGATAHKIMKTVAFPLPPRAVELLAQGLSALDIVVKLGSEGHTRPDGMLWSYNDMASSQSVFSCRRILERTVNFVVRELAKRAGLTSPVRPHGLRHASITRALDLTNGDIRKVARFARHRDPKITLAYDDDRQDLAGSVARLVGDDGPQGKG
jgi:integrase/recombinase XerC